MKYDLSLSWWYLNPQLKIEVRVGVVFISVAFQCLRGRGVDVRFHGVRRVSHSFLFAGI